MTDSRGHVTARSHVAKTPCGRKISINWDRMFSHARICVQVQERAGGPRAGTDLYTEPVYFSTEEAAHDYVDKLVAGELTVVEKWGPHRFVVLPKGTQS